MSKMNSTLGQKKKEKDFADKYIHASISSHYDSDGLDNLCATMQCTGVL
jgi:hypothetical protein